MEQNIPPQQTQGDAKKDGLAGGIERFRALPAGTQMLVLGVFAFFLLMFFLRGGEDAPRQAPPQQTKAGSDLRALDGTEDEDPFSGLQTDRPALMQRWLQQQQVALADIQSNMEGRFESLREENAQDREDLDGLRTEIRQMINTFQDEIKTLESSNKRDREILGRLAEETRKLQLQQPVQNAQVQTVGKRKQRISQVALTSPVTAGVDVDSSQALLNPAVRTVEGVAGNNKEDEAPKPFIPPLGFVNGTLLNGVDALAGGGQATPALVRLSGVYKTAMNSTVNLNGCFALVEFEGDISTERALGKPSRMTCVYPDQGAVTYSVSGYVVDKADGIIGMPGVFYEGNASRLAIAMAADFAASVAQVVESNQKTSTTNADGVTTETITGDQTQAAIAGGSSQAINSLRDYLFERANRILPFIRIDSTRDLNIVFLSGNQLRSEGNAWTLLFDAEGK